MKRSIFSKIFIGYILIILALSSLILLLSFQTIRRHYIDTLAENLKNTGLSLIPGLAPMLDRNKFDELDEIVKELGRKINIRITIINIDGKVLADSEKDPVTMENHKNRPEIREALRGKMGRSLRFSTTVGEEMLYIAIPLEKEGKIIGVIRVSLFLKEINNLLGNLKNKIIRIALIIAVISLLVAIIFSRGLSSPIKELAMAARKVASGDFNVRIFLKNKDELKELEESFNYMTLQIKTLFNEIALQKDELNNIISSLREGLIVLDKKGRIKLANSSFKTLVENDSIEGKFYWEILREHKFVDLIKKATESGKNFTEELELDSRTFLCSVTLSEFSEAIVIVFHDITELKNLERIKRDFVINVSHELRTPLTAIKGFVETLEDEIDRKGKNYLKIIKRHTDRLINIVQDLLLLSELEELEDSRTKLQMEHVDLRKMIKDILKMFEQRLKVKKLKLKLDIDKKLPEIKGDTFKLEQMFINLIDNAIKYTERGEIRIKMYSCDSSVRIEISDTGIGIPREHLLRIFERFYVVDKSRSRKLGGTGLGLSIVKHIVLMHNGRINVKSKPGAGTKFIITLPYN